MQGMVIGWDIGGAHIKAAKVDANGKILQVELQACPLWLGMDQLHSVVTAILAALNAYDARHVLTMTGELVDLFANREEGVAQILFAMRQLLGDSQLTIFAGQVGFVAYEQVMPVHYPAIASANWLASAMYVAQRQGCGLFVDVGSTTTDILLFNQGRVDALGLSDYQRLQSEELVYTGVVRTAVMAVAQYACLNGQRQGLMAEYFATMADVYRLTGDLQEWHDQTATADGAEKTVTASARRLSRMTGYDFDPNALALWREFAGQLRQQQLQLIFAACQRQLSRRSLPASNCLVGAGIGRFLVKSLALQLDFPYIDFAEILHADTAALVNAGSDCAPAVAVACLYA